MRTVILGPRPPELDALIARRHALGQDTHDEVWEGEYHMSPASHPRHGLVASDIDELFKPRARELGLRTLPEFNIGTAADYRVPDLGIIRPDALRLYMPTAELVVEVVSPGDESWAKFGHYAAHRVGEVVIVDPADHSVAIFVLGQDGYARTDRSDLLDLTSAEVVAAVDWPPTDDG